MDINKRVQMKKIEEIKEHQKNNLYNSPLDEAKYHTLYNSIEEIGIQVPLVINEQSVILAGHHRLKVAKELGLQNVPVRIFTGNEEEEIDYVIQSNAARRSEEKNLMKLAQQAYFYYQLYGVQHGNNGSCQGEKSYKDVATKIGKSVSTTNRLLKLIDLIPDLQELVEKGKIPLMAAVEISKLGQNEQTETYRKISSDESSPKPKKKREIDQLIHQDENEMLNKQVKKMKNNLSKWETELVAFTETNVEQAPKIEKILDSVRRLYQQIERMESGSRV